MRFKHFHKPRQSFGLATCYFLALIVVMISAHGSMAQTEFDRRLLGRVRQQVEANLAGLTNFTCGEMMDRSIRTSSGATIFRERLRLDVLGTASGDLFSWPGSASFANDPPGNWIAAGAIGTGNFVGFLHNLFVSSAATIEYKGIETTAQQALYRFDFRVPLLGSKHTLVVEGVKAETAYSGSFWVDQKSLDVVRLETHAQEIPPELDCREERQSVTYGRIRLGIDDRLLPSAAELTLISREGIEHRNSVTFSGCRHYSVESSLSFKTNASPARTLSQSAQVTVPPGTTLILRLNEPISDRESAAGDQIVAVLQKAVMAGPVRLPKGTRVLGRTRRLEQHLSQHAWTLVGLEFFAAETPMGRVTFSARLTGPRAGPDVVTSGDLNHGPEVVHNVGLDIDDDGRGTGVGTFRIDGKELHIARGFRTIWKTQ